MSVWETKSEEASIVLVGNFNPKIFHPEWFIRKGIVEEWDYGKDELVNLADLSQMELPGGRKLTVVLNQFVLRSSLASDFVALKDFVTSTFSVLRETPIRQMGMNRASIIKVNTKENWRQFGRELAPPTYWEQAAGYVGELDAGKQEMMGLWELSMNLPRPDENQGYIRPKITAVSLVEHTLSFSINNHVEIDQSAALNMVKILEDSWDKSLEFAQEITLNIMNSQLRNTK